MTLQDAAYSHSPARIRQQSSAPTLPTSPRAGMNASASNSSPAPRLPMGRSPHKLALRNSQAQFAQAAGEEGDDGRRSSVDSAAIFSIYSMYGSEYGSASVPALPAGADRASGSWRDSQGPSPLSSSSYSTNQDAPHTNAAWASHFGNDSHTAHDHHSQDQTPRNSLFQQHRQRTHEDRTSQVPAAASRVPFEAAAFGDSEHRSTGFTGTQASTPPSSYQRASGVNGKHVPRRSSSFSTYSDDLRRVQSDNEDDESLALDVDFGSTVGSQSSPPSPSSRKASMSFFSSSSRRSKKSNRTAVTSAGSDTGLAYFDSGVMPSVPAPPRTPSPSSAGTSRAPSAISGVRSGLDRQGMESNRGSYAGSGNGSANGEHRVRIMPTRYTRLTITFFVQMTLAASRTVRMEGIITECLCPTGSQMQHPTAVASLPHPILKKALRSSRTGTKAMCTILSLEYVPRPIYHPPNLNPIASHPSPSRLESVPPLPSTRTYTPPQTALPIQTHTFHLAAHRLPCPCTRHP